MSHPNLPTTEGVWFLECSGCKVRRKYGHYIATTQFAVKHATRHEGHVVIVYYEDYSDGKVFYRSYAAPGVTTQPNIPTF